MNDLLVIFENVPDPRDINARHDLGEMLFIALLAMMCGAESCVEMALFANQKAQMLRRVLALEHGIPSHDTFSRVFQRLDPAALEAAFENFMRAFAQTLAQTGARVLSVDGKCVKRAYEKGKPHMPPMMVSVWGAALRMTLAQTQAGAGGEAEAALDLIKRVSLKGAVLTADALHCHKNMAAAVKAGGGDYVLALKTNQPRLHRQALALIEAKAPHAPFAETRDEAHGRIETRRAIVVGAQALGAELAFPGLKAIARMTRRRQVNGKVSEEHRLYALSRKSTPRAAMEIIRAHWDIENGSHWKQDVILHEDYSRTRKDNGPRNLALIRRLTANILTSIPDKASMKSKRLKAAWTEDYMFNALTHMR